MLIACSYKEIWPPQVLAMEKAILGKLEWYLTVSTPCIFLVRYIKASVSRDLEMENMVFFLVELGLAHYDTVVLYSPSMIAAAAVYAGCCTLNRSPFCSATLKHHTGYSKEQLMNRARQLVGFHQIAAKGEPRVNYSKFASPAQGEILWLSYLRPKLYMPQYEHPPLV